MIRRYQLTAESARALRFVANEANVATADQLAERLLRASLTSTRRRLTELLRRQLLRRIDAYARRPAELTRLAQWEPGEPECDTGQVSYQSRQRWLQLPLERVVVYAATRRGAALCGAPVARIKRHQIGHDLAVGDLVLWLRRYRPQDAEHWKGETLMARTRSGRGEKLPDGFLVENRQVTRVFELCSGYRKDRLDAFCADCYGRGLPFEIWG